MTPDKCERCSEEFVYDRTVLVRFSSGGTEEVFELCRKCRDVVRERFVRLIKEYLG